MADHDDPLEAIDKFLGAIRAELAANPEMAYRIVKSLPVNVNFEAAELTNFVNPLELIASNSEDKARELFYAFKLADLKKMARRVNLASSTDVAGLKNDELIDLIMDRGTRKIAERST